MAFKHWPLVRDLRFAQKSGRFLRGARKRRPDLNWREFRRIACHFQGDEMGSLPERGYLFQLASDLPVHAQAIEVGAWTGAATCFIAAGLKGDRSRILAVDNFQGTSTRVEEAASYRRLLSRLRVRNTLEIFRSNLAALGLSSKSEPVVSDSLVAARTLESKKGSIDFVFIDADHSYEACKADIMAWAPFVKRGGILALHDFGSQADGVTRAVFEETKAGRFADIAGVAGTIIAFRM